MLGLSVALSTGTGIAAQEGTNNESAREKLLEEAISLLDKVELSSPRSQVEVMRVRERLVKLQNIDLTADDTTDTPELSFSRSGGNTTSVSRKNKAKRVSFYNECKGLRNNDLLQQLRGEISHHKSVDYSTAREIVILDIDNRAGDVECVYTGKIIHTGDKMPSSTVLNIEHTWPQSKGAKGVAKTDMHHLYATDSKANSIRSSLPFGNIDPEANCKFEQGGSRCNGKVFEVRKQHRGNVARSMFYFSTCYNQRIDPQQEAVLRQWHKEDPVDANEIARNDKIEAIQNNRNPFIDHPEYVDMIQDF